MPAQAPALQSQAEGLVILVFLISMVILTFLMPMGVEVAFSACLPAAEF